jgi:hypothetical protein
MANFCTECGKAVQPNANFCDNCGTKLVQVEQPKRPYSDRRFEEKRARVLGQNQSNNKPKFVLLGLPGPILLLNNNRLLRAQWNIPNLPPK